MVPGLVPALSLVAALVAAGCAATTPPPSPAEGGRDDPRRAELKALMKLRLNPSFSRIHLLLFYADEAAAAGQGDALQAVAALEATVGELRRLRDPPVGSAEARLVFAEYASHLEGDVVRLRLALAEGRAVEAPGIFDRLRRTCDHCHHFFRVPKTSER